MSTEIEIHHSTTLAMSDEQNYWNESQLATLRHIGVENASEGDLTVFHHVCKRTGLDPFARQIYMIGRNTKDQKTNQWVTKYTIQTGIDGFRLIGRRAADASRETISVTAPQWAHSDGTWRDVWVADWGMPIAARVTILRNGEPFAAVALFDEYKQTKSGGGLTHMWQQRPAGQVAKCAEALAWRMAFPQDLSGIYADDEMGQADRPERHASVTAVAAPDRMRAMLNTTAAEQVPDAPDLDPGEELTQRTRGHLFALFAEHGITDRDEQIRGIVHIVGREIESRSEITEAEGLAVVAKLEARARPDAQPVTAEDAFPAEVSS